MKLILCLTYLLTFFNANAEEATTVELVQIVKKIFPKNVFIILLILKNLSAKKRFLDMEIGKAFNYSIKANSLV